MKVLKSVKWVDAGGNQCTIRDAKKERERGKLYVETIGKGTWIGVHMSREAENKLRKLLNERRKERKALEEDQNHGQQETEDPKTTEQKSLLKGFNCLCQSKVKTDLITKTNLMVDLLEAISIQRVSVFAKKHNFERLKDLSSTEGQALFNYYSRVIREVLERVES